MGRATVAAGDRSGFNACVELIGESAQIPASCPDCASSGIVILGHGVIDGHWSWSRSFRCDACRTAVEEDHAGPGPPDVRAALRASNGVWLICAAGAYDRVTAMRVLRRLVPLSMAEARTRADELTDVGIEGTHTEVTWLAGELERGGVALGEPVRRA